MTTDLRYAMEHSIIPRQFQTYQMAFIQFLLKGEGVFYQWVQDCYQQEQLDLPYQPEDYKIRYFKMADHVFIVALSFPEPERASLCHEAYLAFDTSFRWQHYFTLEKSHNLFGNKPMLCAWVEGSHVNYGSVQLDQVTVLDKCLDVIKELYLEDKS